jgi:HSP20 family protein
MTMDVSVNNAGWLFHRGDGRFFNGMAGEFERTSPPIDVVEDNDGYRFTIELPGLKPDSLEVKIEEETLVINAERSKRALAEGAQVHRAQRNYGHVHSAFTLPSDVSRDAIKAAYKDGVLEVTIAKRPEAKALKVEVAYN